MIINYIVVVLVCFAGAILQAAIGFGFPIIGMIFMSMIFPMPAATTIVQTSGIVGVGYLFFKYIRQVKWKTLLPFLLCALATGTFLTWYSSGLSVPDLKMYMGILLILIAVFMLFAAEKVKLKPTIPVGCSMGVLSGIMNGFFAIGGPPVALYLLPAIDDKIAYIATANAYFFLFKVFNLPLRFTNGSVGAEHIGYILASVASMTVGTFVGEHMVMLRIDKKLMSKLVYAFVIISGLIIVIQEVTK